MTDMSDPVITHVDSIAGGKIGVRTLGNGPGLIVIHGSLDEGSQWIPFAEALAARFTVHLVDSRGRGLSDDFPADYGPATIVADHRAVLKLAGDGVVLFGHSFGATSVLQTAVAEAPELAGVVVYEPPLPLGGPYSGEEIDHYASSLERGDVDGALSRAFVTLVGGTEEDLALLRKTPVWPEMLAVAPTWLPELRLVDSLPFDTDAFHAINVPVLGIRGGRSGGRLRGTTEAAVAAVPHGTLVDIPHIEHSGHLTDPADLAQAVLHWYDTVLAQTSLNDPPVSDCKEGSITVSDTFLTTTDAHQLSSLFVQYFDAGNVEGLLSLYEEGATLYVPGSTPSEPVPLRAAFEQFAAMGLHVEVKTAIVLVNGNLALSHGDLALVSADQRIEVKTAEVLRRQDDGTWRYVIDNAIGSAILEALTPDNSRIHRVGYAARTRPLPCAYGDESVRCGPDRPRCHTGVAGAGGIASVCTAYGRPPGGPGQRGRHALPPLRERLHQEPLEPEPANWRGFGDRNYNRPKRRIARLAGDGFEHRQEA